MTSSTTTSPSPFEASAAPWSSVDAVYQRGWSAWRQGVRHNLEKGAVMTNKTHSSASKMPTLWRLAAGAAVSEMTLAAFWMSWTRFNHRVQRAVAAMLVASTGPAEGVITEEMLRDLPTPVRRYLTYTGIVGKPRIQTVHLKQRGAMRLSPRQPWIALRGEQFYTVQPPGFVWDGTLHLGLLPLARARDQYRDGRGNMFVTLDSLVTVADSWGAEMDQAALMRYLSEMPWFPTAFLGENVSFEAIDDASARVILSDRGRSVSGTLYVDAEGRLTNFVGQRCRTVGSGYSLDTWSTPMLEYGELAGLRLPIRGKAVWKLPEGDFDYIDVTIAELEYNVVSKHVAIAMARNALASEAAVPK